jgi:hypothetical protein
MEVRWAADTDFNSVETRDALRDAQFELVLGEGLTYGTFTDLAALSGFALPCISGWQLGKIGRPGDPSDHSFMQFEY